MTSDTHPDSFDWLEAELQDTLDEDIEIEFAEPMLSMELRKIYREQHPEMLDRQVYFRNLLRLQAELIKLQDWVVETGAKVLVIMEGRDSAGKGGVIKRITQRLNPRVARVVALPAPSRREQSQWYFQRYVPYLPSAGEIVLFDRSWYNRAGVERVMEFCTPEEYLEFMRVTPEFIFHIPKVTTFHYWLVSSIFSFFLLRFPLPVLLLILLILLIDASTMFFHMYCQADGTSAGRSTFITFMHCGTVEPVSKWLRRWWRVDIRLFGRIIMNFVIWQRGQVLFYEDSLL